MTKRLPRNQRPAAPAAGTPPPKSRWYDGMDVGGCCLDGFDDLAILVVAVVAVVALVFVLPPLVLVGIDLLWLVLVFLAGAIGRFLLGRPWSVEAVDEHGERREWKLKGFRGAGQLRDTLQVEFDAGLDPRPDTIGG
ncbi:MAG: hypothetical protein WCC60_07180 [Ilumatobacteraceae bacterium]